MKKIETVVISFEKSESEALGVLAGIICDSHLKCSDCPMNINKVLPTVVTAPHALCLSRICADILVRYNGNDQGN